MNDPRVTEETEIVDGDKRLFVYGKDELNLAEFPIALLSEKIPEGLNVLEFHDQIYDKGKGRLVQRKLEIEGSETYGLPTAKDDEVILALIQLSKQQDFRTRKVEFTRYELIDLLGWSQSGQSYTRIELSLQRWVSVTLRYENAWWDKSEERWTSGAFHIIDDFEINDSREHDRRRAHLSSQIRWNERIYKSFLDGQLKTIRYDLYVNLRHPTSKRMYRFLDKRFHLARNCDFDLHDFAYEHIGLSRSYKDCGKIKEKLAPALRELEQIGYLVPLDKTSRYQKSGRARWRIHLTRHVDAAHQATKPQEAELAAELPIVAELIARGISPSTARDLARNHSVEQVVAKIQVFDWLAARQDRRVAKSPAGYLVKSIDVGYAIPAGFKSPAEVTRDLEEKEVARIELEQRFRKKTKDEIRARREKEAREHRVRAYLESLDPSERAAVEAQALAAAPGKGRVFADVFITLYVEQLLGLDPVEAEV